MSAEDYDQVEKLFCGTWKAVRDENVEEFMTAAGMSEEMKNFARQERMFTTTREGNSFREKSKIGDLEFELTLKLNEETEWKEKEENPVFHVKTHATFKDGIWHQETTPLNEGGGKKQVMSCQIQGDELIADMSLPDVPGVTGRRIFQKC